MNATLKGIQEFPVQFYDAGANIRVYVSRAELTARPIESVHRHETAETKLFADILAHPGVVMVVGKPYELAVQKADLYAWDEIHPRVLDELLAVNLIPMTPISDAKQ